MATVVVERTLNTFKKRGKELVLDVAVSAVWLVYAGGYLRRAIDTRDPLGLGLMVFYTLVAVFFVLREPNRKECSKWETVLAVGAVFLPMLLLRPTGSGASVAGSVIQGVALLGILVALVSLGRSFGIAPADRGLVTSGLYRWIRHPLYATETLFYVGFLVSNPSWRNAIGFVMSLAVHVLRIHLEERILEGYEGYARNVRWRMMPFVW
jgi:protein-S-isoprenylcysteine O-methyltransferase Ste14